MEVAPPKSLRCVGAEVLPVFCGNSNDPYLRAERRLGEMMVEMPKAQNLDNRARTLAAMPKGKFD
jgi:hypothetical protein